MTTQSRDERALIDKAWALLEALSQTETAGVSELARRADLSKSTAFRVLGSLERQGAVVRDGARYRIGAGLRRLTDDPRSVTLARWRESASPHLVSLHAATGATIHLASLEGGQVHYLHKVQGLTSVRTRARQDVRAPAHCTSSGKVLLATDPEAADRVLGTRLTGITSRSITRPDALRRELVRTTSRSLAVDLEESMPGVTCAAVAIRLPDRSGHWALSAATAGPPALSRVEPALRRAGLALTRELAESAARRRPAQLASA